MPAPLPPSPPTAGELPLIAHPDTPDGPVTAISVRWAVHAEGIRLRFRLCGQLDRVALPPPAAPGPADRLWEHTCCEAFVAPAGASRYREFNFAPGGQWAIYDFSAYRQRADRAPAARLAIDCRLSPAALELAVAIPGALLPDAAGDALAIGLSCVVEDIDGNRSYWALAHPAAHPDFHHRDAFALTLPGAAI